MLGVYTWKLFELKVAAQRLKENFGRELVLIIIQAHGYKVVVFKS
jgi:hypothetical protein